MSKEPLLTPLTEAHISLLEARGINAETAVNLGWKTCEDRKGDWIAIPFLRDGKPVNHKYRTISGEKKFSQDKGGEQCFYNIDAFKSLDKLTREHQTMTEIVIVEGEMDCAVAIQCGHTAVSVPSGAPEKAVEGEESAKFEFLKDFPKLCIAVLAVDDDIAGRVLRQELGQRLGWHRCKWVQFPKECKDLNDVFRKYGQKGVDKVLKDKAKFMNQGGLMLMSEMVEEPPRPSFDPMIPGVSNLLKMRQGDSIVVTGIPNMGKSTFVNCLAASMAHHYAWNCTIASFETHPRAGLQKYLRTYFLEKPPISKEGFDLWTPAEIAEADEWINRRFSFIVADVMSDDLTSFKWLLERMRAAITRYNSRLLIVDPWNEIDHDRPQGMTLTEYTGFAIKEIKRLADRYRVTPIIVGHPTKMEKNKEGEYDIPDLYDMSDSSHWKNKFDIGMVIHLLKGETPGDFATLYRSAKVREWDVMGNIGDVTLKYNPSNGRYTEYPDFVPKKPKEVRRAKTEKVAAAPAQAGLPLEEPPSEVPVRNNMPYKDD